MSYALAFSRLAPVQCVTWGHPVTTGIPTLDYFISSDLLEADGAEDHYTERLVRLKTLPIYYYRPEVPPRSRRRCGSGRITACASWRRRSCPASTPRRTTWKPGGPA